MTICGLCCGHSDPTQWGASWVVQREDGQFRTTSNPGTFFLCRACATLHRSAVQALLDWITAGAFTSGSARLELVRTIEACV